MRPRRALVVSVTDRTATILTDDGEFLVRRLDHEAAEGSLVLVTATVGLGARLRRIGMSAAAAIMILFAIFSPGLMLPDPEVFAYISIDMINPSVELEVDSRGHVIGHRHTNEEGRLLLTDAPCRNMVLDRFVERLINTAMDIDLAHRDVPVLITVIPHAAFQTDSRLSELAELAVCGVKRAGGTAATLVSWNPGINRMARELELSGGRYLTVLAAEAAGTFIPVEEASGRPIGELISWAGGIEAVQAASLADSDQDQVDSRYDRRLSPPNRSLPPTIDTSPFDLLWVPSFSR